MNTIFFDIKEKLDTDKTPLKDIGYKSSRNFKWKIKGVEGLPLIVVPDHVLMGGVYYTFGLLKLYEIQTEYNEIIVNYGNKRNLNGFLFSWFNKNTVELNRHDFPYRTAILLTIRNSLTCV